LHCCFACESVLILQGKAKTLTSAANAAKSNLLRCSALLLKETLRAEFLYLIYCGSGYFRTSCFTVINNSAPGVVDVSLIFYFDSLFQENTALISNLQIRLNNATSVADEATSRIDKTNSNDVQNVVLDQSHNFDVFILLGYIYFFNVL